MTASPHEAAYFQVVCDNVHTALVAVDEEGRVRSANRAAAEIFRFDRAGARGRPYVEVFGWENEELASALQIALRTGERAFFACAARVRGDRRLFLEGAVTPLPEEGESLHFLIALEDRSERQQLLADASQREKMAAIGLLAAGVAHEFNNIWSAVHGYAELARQDESFLKDLVEVTLEQAGRAAEIIRGLLSFSDKRSELRRGVKLGRILKSIAQLVQMELRTKSVTLTTEVKDDPEIVGSEGQLQQVFLNLVINAFHAVGQGGRIALTLGLENSCAVAQVEDDGCGMDEAMIAQIYDPFFTTKGAFGGSAEAEGHGLGLTLTYNIVRAHNGTIDVKSAPGQGTRFTVTLPVAPPEEGAAHRPGTRQVGKRSGRIRRILYVEDEVVLHGILRAILDDHEIDAFVTAEEALAAAEARPYDLAFIDLILAGRMDGYELCDRLRERKPALPVVLMTGRLNETRLEEYRKRVSGILLKPFTMRDIRAAFERAAAVGEEAAPGAAGA